MASTDDSETTDVDASVATQLRDEIEQARAALEKLEADYEIAVTDSSVLQEDQDSLRILVERSRAHHVNLQKALERHEAGTYGTCESCGGAIAPERLKAVPDAALCRDCSV